MSDALIFHVIGTLPFGHIEASLESLARQGVRWKTFVLYNGSTEHADEAILALVPDMFDRVVVFPYDPATPKSASADWEIQFKEIGGHDRYFVLKADFYLPRGTLRAWEEMDDPFVLFHKLDMKERATLGDFRAYADFTWAEALARDETGSYETHLRHLCVPFRQRGGRGGSDGVMHAYRDEVRGSFALSAEERESTWGDAYSIIDLVAKHGGFDHDLFVIHMWHEIERGDDRKMIPGERF